VGDLCRSSRGFNVKSRGMPECGPSL
jgi:hypothetical protein